ncbi:MAG: hypothetical protein R3Y15_02925 [Rikenellaceae bacterium]
MAPTNYSTKQEPLFELISSMSKAEKRNFKLYATRLQGNQNAKFIQLFDTIEPCSEYNEKEILARCPSIKKAQLANLKAHLYKQILISIRMLDTQHVLSMRIREQLDFANILYERGLSKQAAKILDKIIETAIETEYTPMAIEILELRKKLEMSSLTHNRISEAESIGHQITKLSTTIARTSDIADTSLRLYGLHLKLGYARSDKDLSLIRQTFQKRLHNKNIHEMSFTERFQYHEACVWYYYIQHDFVKCYRHACYWVELYHNTPHMKELRYNDYLHGYSSLLDGLFLMRDVKRFRTTLADLEKEKDLMESISNNASVLYHQVRYLNRINLHLLQGSFSQGIKELPEIKDFVENSRLEINIHDLMLLQSKVAYCYFGNGDYLACMKALSPVISNRDPQVRRDLQGIARVLNFICCYESGIDYNLDYQIRSVYTFLVKMNDMNHITKEMINFIKTLRKMPVANLKEELTTLYDKLLPYAGTTSYHSRTFYYLDITTWLKSKITGENMSQIIQKGLKKEKSRI